jgi:hypothetical protein
VIHNDAAGRPIDRRVLGTNLPAWLGPQRLADPLFVKAVLDSGTTLLRMPGGSWSNGYDWSGCEVEDADRCADWAARPSDFIDLLQASGVPGMWTISANATAPEAAAAVAFFNGEVGDDRVLGVDRNGVDWGTVGRWAELRAAHGNPLPVPIELWEFGNEVYGGRPERGGDQCAEFGWEDVWTCDGTEYVTGGESHDGYTAVRAAMRNVDPAIAVSAVGVADPSAWSNWGEEVIQSAGRDLDMYSIHQYGFDQAPEDEQDALARPEQMWSGVIGSAREALPPNVPIAVTEYNMVAFESGDTDQLMTRAVNALYLADTIGQLVQGGVAIANQWNMANGRADNGTDYGLVDADSFDPYPQFHALAAWSATGSTLLTSEGIAPDGVHVYPTGRDDGTVVIVVINLNDAAEALDLELAISISQASGTLTTFRADQLDDTELVEEDAIRVSASDGAAFALSVPAWSISVLEVSGGG